MWHKCMGVGLCVIVILGLSSCSASRNMAPGDGSEQTSEKQS